LSCKTGIAALKRPDGSYAVTEPDKAETLNRHFMSVNVPDNGNLPSAGAPRLTTPSEIIDHVHFSDIKLFRAVANTKSKYKTSSGPDEYPQLLLTKTIASLVSSLTMIFDSFMSVGRVPSMWKKAIITPVFKKGPAADPSNYRPIAQTSVFCKLMERVISRDIFLYLKAHGLLNTNQYGFTARRSTLTDLLDSLYDWTSSLENKFATDVIYIDFHKAFDTVSHPKLFYKLESSGIVGSLLSLIRDLLSNRLQCTKVGNSYSDYTDVTCGVVQGSVLGPLLF
jgi:hypothetical protein